jgi:hypothetical protein
LACKKKLYDKFSDSNTDEQHNNRQQHIIDELHNTLSYNFFSPLFFTLTLRKKRQDQYPEPATGKMYKCDTIE